MNTSQSFFPIKTVRDDLVVLKDGSMAVVIQTSAVNFDLLSENEQLAIISSFAGLLNSLNFFIQIIIRSKRLDISSYLKTLVKAEGEQSNPLLKQMISRYRVFIETTISENEVLDKQFYIVIPISSIELGIKYDVEKGYEKALTTLLPRRDHIIRQLGRIGLKATQLNNEQLVKLFYDIYNGDAIVSSAFSEEPNPDADLPQEIQAQTPAPNPEPPPTPSPSPQPIASAPVQPQLVPSPTVQPPPAPQQSTSQQSSQPTSQLPPLLFQNQPRRPSSNHAPFVVEELKDEYGTAS